MGQKRKYIVTKTVEEREQLKQLVQQGKTTGLRIRHAQILLKLDDITENCGWTGKQIASVYQPSENNAT